MKQTWMSESDRAQSLCDQFGHAIVERLEQGLVDTPHEVTERLRVARLYAVERRRLATRGKVSVRATSGIRASSTVVSLSGGEEGGWGLRWVAALPVVALVAGLLFASGAQTNQRDLELAEVDSALLTDDLPPAAYADPGFMQFLKSPHGTAPH